MIVHFSAQISKWEFACTFGVIFHISINFLPRYTVSCMKLVNCLFYNNLFIYQVLCTLIYRRRSLYSFFKESFCMDMLFKAWDYIRNTGVANGCSLPRTPNTYFSLMAEHRKAFRYFIISATLRRLLLRSNILWTWSQWSSYRPHAVNGFHLSFSQILLWPSDAIYFRQVWSDVI